MENKKIVKIFWTGGLDSTFRILQLSHYPIIIKPFYLRDNRKSELKEINAINQITKILKRKSFNKSEILPLNIINKEDRKEYKQISNAYNNLYSKQIIGSQYKWLAGFAMKNIGIELSVKFSENGSLANLINDFILIKDEIIGDYYIIDKNKVSQDVHTLFGNFHFPLKGYAIEEVIDYFYVN